MPNRKSRRSKKSAPKREFQAGSNQCSGLSKVDWQELEARMASPMPSREASVDCSKVSFNGDVQDPEHTYSEHEQVREAVRSPLQNHDRMDLGRRYCLLAMIYKATH